VKVLYLTQGWTVHDRRFVTGLLDAGHQVVYRAVGTIPAARAKELEVGGVLSVGEWRASGPDFWFRLPGLVMAVRRLCQETHPDIVHAGPIQRGAFLAAVAGCRPLVSMSWGSDLLFHARGGVGRWIARWTLRRSDSLLCDCEAVRRESVRLGIDRARIVVFPWGVDLDKFTPGGPGAVRETLGWKESFVLISARAWEPGYGVDLVAEAFAAASSEAADLRLMLLGDGSEKGRVHRRLEAGGALRQTYLPGPIEHKDLPGYFRDADLYVSASRRDGSSVTMLEAMACGLPALVSDIPPNLEWVDGGSNGWTFRDGDSLSLAAAILQARKSRTRLKEMGAAARRVTEKRADWSKNFPRLQEAYELAQAGSKRRGLGA
jgi:glycosyltransferase involved in cell wall biosynthesis